MTLPHPFPFQTVCLQCNPTAKIEYPTVAVPCIKHMQEALQKNEVTQILTNQGKAAFDQLDPFFQTTVKTVAEKLSFGEASMIFLYLDSLKK